MENYIKTLVFLSLNILALAVFGQSNYEEVVYLKDGGIVRGVIIEQIPNESLKIETRERNVFVYKLEDISKITKEKTADSVDSDSDNKNSGNGYVHIIEINYSPGINNVSSDGSSQTNEAFGTGFKVVNGYKIEDAFLAGLGVGIDQYQGLRLIPITIDVRLNLTTSNVRPVIYANFGQALSITEGIKGGTIINMGFGFSWKINEKASYLFSIGYRRQTIEYEGYSYNDPYGYPATYSNNLEFISVNIGFQF